MLFIFETADFHGIWMKNCKFPIDILWLDEERKVVHVAEARAALQGGAVPGLQPDAPGRRTSSS